jgi:hypothetical protein
MGYGRSTWGFVIAASFFGNSLLGSGPLHHFTLLYLDSLTLPELDV